MNAVPKTLLTYSEIRNQQRMHPLRQYEIPVEHAVSLPLPTKRWGSSGYAFFASPGVRRPGYSTEQGAPDRWWVVEACGGHILIYAQWKALPFTDGVSWTTVQLPSVSLSVAELQKALDEIEGKMNTLVPAFFEEKAAASDIRKSLLDQLLTYLPQPLITQYRGLAPDFWQWLEG